MLKWPLAILTSVTLLGLPACKKKAGDAGQPVAAESAASRAARGLPALPPGSAAAMRSHDPAPTDPHAGMDPGQNPHAGMDIGQGGSDPHAGMDIGQGGGDPHAGMDIGQGGGDPHAGMDPANPHGGAMPGADPHAGMDPADPHGGAAAAADPDLQIEGTVAVDPKLKDQVQKGAVVFLSARSVKSKSVVAVGRVVVDDLPMPFHLDAHSSMMGGAATLAKGDKVLLDIVVDKDGDPIHKQGEVEALSEVEVPAKGLKLTFDHIREAP